MDNKQFRQLFKQITTNAIEVSNGMFSSWYKDANGNRAYYEDDGYTLRIVTNDKEYVCNYNNEITEKKLKKILDI